MTSGTRTSGSSVPVSTNSGPGFEKVGYFTKTWSGANSPITPKPLRSSTPAFRRLANVYTPRGKIEVEVASPIAFPSKGIKSREERFLLNDYSCDISIITDKVFGFRFGNPPSGPTYTGTGMNTGYGNRATSNPWTSNDDLALIGRLREEIAGSSFNLAVTTAESREAFSMITNAASRIYGAYRLMRKGNFQLAARKLTEGTSRRKISDKSIASNWLELQYGWLPLLADAQSGAQYLAEYGLRRRSRRYSVRLSKSGSLGPAVGGANVVGTTVARGQLIAYIDEVNEASLIGLTDPLSVAWELIPYSFVVDWFLPIGDFLQARALSSAVTGGFVKTLTTRENWKAGDCKLPKFTSSGIVTTGSTVSVRRSVSSSIVVPLPSIVPISDAIGWKRAANAVSLLRVRL